MSIRLICSACQKTLQVPDTAAGKKARCPSCKALNDVPAASTTTTETATAKPAVAKPVAAPKAPAAAPQAATAKPAPASPQNKSENIPISCSGCGKSFRAPKAAAGKTVKCPNCQGSIAVPNTGAGGAANPKPSPTQAPRAVPAADPFAGAAAVNADPFGMPAQGQSNSLWDAIGDAQAMQTASAPSWSQPAANPYAGPGNFGGGGAYSGGGYGGGGYASQGYRRAGRSPALYIIPAVFISLWGLLIVAGAILRFVGTIIALTNLPPNATIDYARFTGFIIGMILGFILGLIQLSGGISMAMRSNLALARTAAFINAIPCFGILTFPFGIWAAVLLTTGSVKKDFGQ